MKYVTTIERMAEQRGLEQGVEQGLEQGVETTLRESILTSLQVRFASIPDTLIETLDSIGDSDLLRQFFQQTFTVDSLASFTQAVTQAAEQNGTHDDQT